MIDPIAVPAGLAFAALELEREPVTHRLLYRPEPLAELCRHNGCDAAGVLADEDLSMWFIAEWYYAHGLVGGEPDTVVEQILAEVAERVDGSDPVVVGGSAGPH